MSTAIGDLAVDTNAAVAYLQGNPRAIEVFESAGALFLPTVCLGELYFGALHSARVAQNLARLQPFVELCAVVSVTRNTAMCYAEIRQALDRKGRPIPEADLWIAAICREHTLPLLSDDSHFDAVDGLVRHRWTDLPPKIAE